LHLVATEELRCANKAILAVAEYLKIRREDETTAQVITDGSAELCAKTPVFGKSDERLPPARMAAGRSIRENHTL
jgi:hypothetical protein